MYIYFSASSTPCLLVQSLWLILFQVVVTTYHGVCWPHSYPEHTDSLKMGTKVKGFFKGLKNISNIFDEGEEETEIQIGMPTDVKHIAHIGVDGPAAESPSWMKGFDGGLSKSGPMESPDMKKGTNNHRITRSEELTRDLPDVPKTSKHRHRSMDNSLDPDSKSSTKTKHTRRHHRIRRSHEKGDLPDIPKKSRRKKPKDNDGSTKSKDSESSSHEPNLDL